MSSREGTEGIVKVHNRMRRGLVQTLINDRNGINPIDKPVGLL